ncbi:hypothetical protein [Agromyces sp. NPDC057865]|uniref:hypothetical protein n=1 Tax=Agromyces sp. NPDC057865 TaxID=3346267 RepID=UPI0036733E3A
MLADLKGRVLDAAAHTPASRRTRFDRIVGAVVAAVLALGLGSAGAAFAFGILPQGPAAPPVATTVASPTATAPPARTFPVETAPPVAVDPGPTPRIGLTCDDLVDTARLDTFLGDRGVPLTGPMSPLTVPAGTGLSSADRAAGEQLGALECEWRSGSDDVWAAGTGGQAFLLRVLPEGTEDAVRYIDDFQLRDPTYGPNVQGPRCLSDGGGIGVGYCELFGVIGSTWVELHASGIVAVGVSDEELRASFLAVTDPLVERLRNASISDRWVPRTTSPTSSADCDAIAATSVVAPLTGVDDLHVAEWWDGPRIGQYWYAKGQVGAQSCSLQFGTGDASLGAIGVLPNGAWAVARHAEAWLSDGGRRIELPAATTGSAILRCGDIGSVCRLDFVAGDDWVSVLVPPSPEGEGVDRAPFETTRANILAIGTIVAERIAALSK